MHHVFACTPSVIPVGMQDRRFTPPPTPTPIPHTHTHPTPPKGDLEQALLSPVPNTTAEAAPVSLQGGSTPRPAPSPLLALSPASFARLSRGTTTAAAAATAAAGGGAGGGAPDFLQVAHDSHALARRERAGGASAKRRGGGVHEPLASRPVTPLPKRVKWCVRKPLEPSVPAVSRVHPRCALWTSNRQLRNQPAALSTTSLDQSTHHPPPTHTHTHSLSLTTTTKVSTGRSGCAGHAALQLLQPAAALRAPRLRGLAVRVGGRPGVPAQLFGAGALGAAAGRRD